MQIIETMAGVYAVTPDAETEEIMQSLADYHQVEKTETLETLINHGKRRYIQQTLAEIDGPPRNKP